MFEINKLIEVIDFNNLTYYYTGKSAPKYFDRFKGPLIIYNDIKNGQVSLQKEEKIQEEFRFESNKILKGYPNYKSEDQVSTIENVTLYNGRGKVLNSYNDYTKMVSGATYKSIMEKGSKH